MYLSKVDFETGDALLVADGRQLEQRVRRFQLDLNQTSNDLFQRDILLLSWKVILCSLN